MDRFKHRLISDLEYRSILKKRIADTTPILNKLIKHSNNSTASIDSVGELKAHLDRYKSLLKDIDYEEEEIEAT